MEQKFENKYKSWSPEEEQYLRDNYKNKTFKQLAVEMGRTADAIRKYLKALKIKKKEKDTRVKQAGKRGRKVQVNSIFAFMEEGKRMLSRKKQVRRLLDEKRRKADRERKWSKEFTQDEKPVIMSDHQTGVRLFLLLNGKIKTTIELSSESKIADKLLKLENKYEKVEVLRTQNI